MVFLATSQTEVLHSVAANSGMSALSTDICSSKAPSLKLQGRDWSSWLASGPVSA